VLHKACLKGRFAQLWLPPSSLKDDPIIMAGPLKTVYRVYGSAAGTTGITHLTMFKDHTVFGPNGFNVDVISHELTMVS
jgi:hypothetical protein